jgi:putative Mn2+ efflux pump MntP
MTLALTKLLLLGVALGLDSFRVSIGLGALHPPPQRRLALAAAFGFCDGASPLVGIWVGKIFATWLANLSEFCGPFVLAGYGLYLIVVSGIGRKQEIETNWQLFGLPIVLSVDNLIAGTGLGMLGLSPFLSATVLGFVSGFLAFGGLWLGDYIGRRIPFRAELFCGVVLVGLGLLHFIDVF